MTRAFRIYCIRIRRLTAEMTKLRQRDVSTGTMNETSSEDSTLPVPIRRRKSLSNRVKDEWDSLLWLFAAFAVFYFTNFASTLMFNDAINGTWLLVSAVSLLVSMGCVAYAVVFLPGLQPGNWRERAPVLITVATVCGIIGGVCLAVAVWPVWTIYSLAILFTLFMGFISAISLLD